MLQKENIIYAMEKSKKNSLIKSLLFCLMIVELFKCPLKLNDGNGKITLDYRSSRMKSIFLCEST